MPVPHVRGKNRCDHGELKSPRHHLRNSDSRIFPLTLAIIASILHDGLAEEAAVQERLYHPMMPDRSANFHYQTGNGLFAHIPGNGTVSALIT